MTDTAPDRPMDFTPGLETHEIDPTTDVALGFSDAQDGSRISLTELHIGEDGHVFAQATVDYIDSALPLGGKVRLSSGVLKTSEAVTLEFIQEHKKGLQIIAASAIVIAAGRGISVYRARHRDM